MLFQEHPKEGLYLSVTTIYLLLIKKEKIQSWKKFHSGLLPVEVTEQMPMIAFPIHSHLKKEPFISATDICTFRLYYNQTGSTKFAVYSPALSMYFVYEIATNTIRQKI